MFREVKRECRKSQSIDLMTVIVNKNKTILNSKYSTKINDERQPVIMSKIIKLNLVS